MNRRLKFPFEVVSPVEDTSTHVDVTVPDQAMSVKEVLERCVRENKPIPKPVEYDIEAIEREYDDLVIPEHLSREDALHLMSRTKSHLSKLEYALEEAKKAEKSSTQQPENPENDTPA